MDNVIDIKTKKKIKDSTTELFTAVDPLMNDEKKAEARRRHNARVKDINGIQPKPPTKK